MNTTSCDGPKCLKTIRTPEDSGDMGYTALLLPGRSRRDFCSFNCLLKYVQLMRDTEELKDLAEDERIARLDLMHPEDPLAEPVEGRKYCAPNWTLTFEIDFPSISMLNACFLQSTLERAWRTRVFVRDVTPDSVCIPRLMHSKGHLCDKGHCR